MPRLPDIPRLNRILSFFPRLRVHQIRITDLALEELVLVCWVPCFRRLTRYCGRCLSCLELLTQGYGWKGGQYTRIPRWSETVRRILILSRWLHLLLSTRVAIHKSRISLTTRSTKPIRELRKEASIIGGGLSRSSSIRGGHPPHGGGSGSDVSRRSLKKGRPVAVKMPPRRATAAVSTSKSTKREERMGSDLLEKSKY